MTTEPAAPSPTGATRRTAPPRRRVVPSRELFGDDREVLIAHEAEEYRLRITRSGKLILTK